MNIENIKKEFPIFDEKIQNNDLVYLDSANSSQKPKVVLDRINDFYSKQFSNVGRSLHYLAVAATNLYENTRTSVQKYINAKDKNEIVFTKGATEALNLVANTLGQSILEPNDEVLITELEHHSNYVPWHFLRKSKNIKIKFAEINEDGDIPIENIEKEITEKTKVIAITHLSNVTGAVLPIKEITQLAHSKGIVVVVDGCQGGPHLKLDMQDLDCDFYTCSAHKMYGPTGIGVLYGKEKYLDAMPPYHGGGEMILEVTMQSATYNVLPHKFEAGTPAIADVIGLGAAIDFLNQMDRTQFLQMENNLRDYATTLLNRLPGVKMIGTTTDKIAVLSFTLDGIHPHDIGTILDQKGIAIRSGHHCTMPVMDFFQVPATTRASIGIYNTEQDIEQLISGLQETQKLFKLKMVYQ